MSTLSNMYNAAPYVYIGETQTNNTTYSLYIPYLTVTCKHVTYNGSIVSCFRLNDLKSSHSEV